MTDVWTPKGPLALLREIASLPESAEAPERPEWQLDPPENMMRTPLDSEGNYIYFSRADRRAYARSQRKHGAGYTRLMRKGRGNDA